MASLARPWELKASDLKDRRELLKVAEQGLA